MKEPMEPSKEDCCNSGCNPCIFDVYERQVKLYRSNKERGDITYTHKENTIFLLKYTPFFVLEKFNICTQHQLILFKRYNSLDNKTVFWSPGDHFLVKYSFEELSCSRAYTPIKIDVRPGLEYDFAILVKRYNNGLVSNYLCNLHIGEQTFWRGPYGNYKINSEYTRIVMLAQGTGIAPLYSLIKYILNDEENMTRVTLFYCCRCINTILLREELYQLKSFWNFVYFIFINKTSEPLTIKYHEPISEARLSSSDLMKLKPFTDNDQFILCGSDEFMNEYNTFLQKVKVSINNIVTL